MFSPVNLIFFAILVLMVNCKFLPQRLRVIDSNPKMRTFLVRGNLPINQNQQFQIEELKGNLSSLTGLKHYRLVVVSLLNTLTAKETKSKYIEDKFFSRQHHIADYRSQIILGSPFDPTQMPNWAARALAFFGSVLDFDDLDDMVEELQEQVHGGNKDTIVYIHCSAGVDRTGYVAGSYKMKYMGHSLREVYRENLQVLGGLRNYMHLNTKNGMQWFCFSLGRTQEECSLP